MTNFAWQRTKLHRLLRRRCTRQGIWITFRLVKKRLIWCFLFIRFRILRCCIDKHCQKCFSQPSENRRMLPSIEWPFNGPLSWNIISIFGVSQYQWATCQPPSMYPPRSWCTLWSVSLHKGHWCSLVILSPFEINKVCILRQALSKWFPIRKFRFWPPPHCPGLCNLDHPVCCILLNILVISLDGVHQTLHSGIPCLGAVLFYHSLILWIFRRTWKQPCRLKTPVIEWMESRCCIELKFESNSRIHRNSPAYTVFSSCTGETHQISQNCINSVRVGCCLMVSLSMLRYHTTQGGYSIGFLAHQYWCSDPHGWDSQLQRAASEWGWNRFHMSSRRWHSWMSLQLRELLPPGLTQKLM